MDDLVNLHIVFTIIRHTKRKKLYVISTLKRPVPLKHFLYTGNSKQTSDQLFEIVGEEKKFITKGYMTKLIILSLKIWLAEGIAIHVLYIATCLSSQLQGSLGGKEGKD